MHIYLSIYLSVYLSIDLSFYIYIYICISLDVGLIVYVHLFVLLRLCVCVLVHSSIHFPGLSGHAQVLDGFGSGNLSRCGVTSSLCHSLSATKRHISACEIVPYGR